MEEKERLEAFIQEVKADGIEGIDDSTWAKLYKSDIFRRIYDGYTSLIKEAKGYNQKWEKELNKLERQNNMNRAKYKELFGRVYVPHFDDFAWGEFRSGETLYEGVQTDIDNIRLALEDKLSAEKLAFYILDDGITTYISDDGMITLAVYPQKEVVKFENKRIKAIKNLATNIAKINSAISQHTQNRKEIIKAGKAEHARCLEEFESDYAAYKEYFNSKGDLKIVCDEICQEVLEDIGHLIKLHIDYLEQDEEKLDAGLSKNVKYSLYGDNGDGVFVGVYPDGKSGGWIDPMQNIQESVMTSQNEEQEYQKASAEKKARREQRAKEVEAKLTAKGKHFSNKKATCKTKDVEK